MSIIQRIGNLWKVLAGSFNTNKQNASSLGLQETVGPFVANRRRKNKKKPLGLNVGGPIGRAGGSNSAKFFFNSRKDNKVQNSIQQGLVDNLLFGRQLFHEGRRVEAISYLEQVILAPSRVPQFGLEAACLLGETYRGIGDFRQAQMYYELGMKESEGIPFSQRRTNDFYYLYRPRVQLGLITVLRRMLDEDHDRIKALLADARNQFQGFPIKDVMAQLNLVEGLYLRQMGDIGGSVQRLKEGMEQMHELDPPFIFLWPEHFQALLVLSQLCAPGGGIHASRIAHELLETQIGPWAQAVGNLALIHLSFNPFTKSRYTKLGDIQLSEELKQRINELEKDMIKHARFEKDPWLLSESIILQILLDVLMKEPALINGKIDQLNEILENAVEPTILLRTIELASLKAELTGIGYAIDQPLFEEKLQQGKQLLEDLTAELKSFKINDKQLAFYHELLDISIFDSDYCFQHWNSKELLHLRLRTWP